MEFSRTAIIFVTTFAAIAAILYTFPSTILPMLYDFCPTVMGVTKALLGMAGVTAMAATLCNMPVSWFMSSEKATLKYLETAQVQTLDAKPRNISASDLWKNNGVVLMVVRRAG